MDDLATHDRAAAIVDLAPRLCPVIEGVEFWITPPVGRRVRCVITDEVLENHYGAANASPSAWMAAFVRHHRDIERRALAAVGGREGVHVVLVNDAFGRLKVSAGRCAS